MRAVIVEDEAVVALDLEVMVEELGHQICGMAATVESALAEIEAHRPDFITVDIKLASGDSGEDVARMAYERWGIRSLFITGNVDSGLIQRTRELRPLGYLSQPVTLASLSCVIGNPGS